MSRPTEDCRRRFVVRAANRGLQTGDMLCKQANQGLQTGDLLCEQANQGLQTGDLLCEQANRGLHPTGLQSTCVFFGKNGTKIIMIDKFQNHIKKLLNLVVDVKAFQTSSVHSLR